MRVGIEAGGTFTDLVAVDGKFVRTAKVPSTPANPDEGAMRALDAAGLDPGAIEELVHGSTVATDAVLERKGAAVCLFVTEADGPDEITAADVETATQFALAELDSGFFRVRIDRATGEERSYLAAMASLGTGPYATGDVAAVLNRTATEVGPCHDTLIRRGLCHSPRHGVIDFTVPMFDEFVRRAMT